MRKIKLKKVKICLLNSMNKFYFEWDIFNFGHDLTKMQFFYLEAVILLKFLFLKVHF